MGSHSVTVTVQSPQSEEVHEDSEGLDKWYRIALLGPNGEFAEGYIERPSKSAVRPKDSVAKRTIPCPSTLAYEVVSSYDDLSAYGWEAVVSDDHVGTVRWPQEGDRDHVIGGPIQSSNYGKETITVTDDT
jgi:hypothetical protein